MPFDNLPAERDEAMAVFTIAGRRTRAFDGQQVFNCVENPDGPVVGAVDDSAVRGRDARHPELRMACPGGIGGCGSSAV